MDTLEQLRSGALAGATRVAISEGLDVFPPELFELADTLQTLDLSGNRLTSLPDDFSRFSQLRILFCSSNAFERLPAVLGACPSLEMIGFRTNRIAELPAESLPQALRWLILTGNHLADLPESLGQCQALQKLMLAGNRLSGLPASMADCTRLELLRLSANRFEALPAWLGRLPRLSWLSFSGNPCSDTREREAQASLTVPAVRWDCLQILEPLGSGASGVISRAIWRDGAGVREVAVKMFKGALTSDGLPHSEMVAWLRAGSHPGLIGVLGRIEGHPEGAEGLVMPLVDSSFTVLAGPPSMQSCTRDVYQAGLRFSANDAWRMAGRVAGAACQLHEGGILHGDLYAHNILHNHQGEALLGDFGAATFFGDAGDVDTPLKALDVRAFGCLLEELAARIEPGEADSGVRAELEHQRDACLQADPAQRPTFAALCVALDAMA